MYEIVIGFASVYFQYLINYFKLLKILLKHYILLKYIFKLIYKRIFLKILFHAQYIIAYILIQINEGIAITFQNFVDVNLILLMWPILQYLHLHTSMILHRSIKQFLSFMNLKMSFNYI